MNLRPKTKRRLLILLSTGLIGSAALSILVVVQLHRYENHRLAYRAAAMDAYQHGDYRTAADNFAKYLGNDRIDSPAIYDYAVCRSKLPRPDLSHLTEAKALFNRYLELNPGDTLAQHQLLDIYQKLRYSVETTDLADQLLQKNPDDVAALSARLGELVRQRNYQAALSVATHLDELTPDDVQTQSLTYELMQHLHRPPAEFIDRAEQMRAAHPADPRFELLRAVAAFCTGDRPGTTQWLRSAASRTPPDASFILLLAGAFDRMELWSDSRTLLEANATAASASPALRANFVQRLWEMGQFDRALLLLKNVNFNDPAADSDLIGLQGLVKFSKDPTDPSLPNTIGILQSRQDDMVAVAWASLLSAICNPSAKAAAPDPLQSIDLCEVARRSDPQNPDADFFLGREYLRIGETEPALQVLRQTTQMQPEWAAPCALIARALEQRGELTSAARAADAAYHRDPENPAIQQQFALLHYQLLPPNAGLEQIQPILAFIHQLRLLNPQEPQCIAAEIDLLARSNQRPQAVDLATASLEKPSATLLLQLVIVNRKDHLGLDKLLIDRLADIQPTSPQEALDQVRADLLCGESKAAKTLLPVFTAHPTPGWTLASLQARELIGDPTTAAGWRQFADSFPDDLSVQQVAAQSAAVAADRPLMDRTIDRLKALTGDESVEWKIDRARFQLSSPTDTKNNAAIAAASMAELARLAPDDAAPQVVWAEALLKLGDLSNAAAHLQLANQINPDNTSIPLNLARLYQQQGQIHEAALLLASVQQNPFLSDSQRMQVALLFRQMGDRDSAIHLLDDQQFPHLYDPSRDELLAQLHCEKGENAAAEKIYTAWIAQKDCPELILQAYANFLAGCGSFDQALQVVSHAPPARQALLRASLEARRGDLQTANSEFAKYTSQSPADENAWITWAGANLRSGDFAETFQIAGDGLKRFPASPTLSALKDRAQALAGLQPQIDLTELLESLSNDPANEAAIATLNALATSETPADTDEHLNSLAAEYPNYLPLQAMVIRRDLLAGRYDSAIDRATRLQQAMPVEPQPAQLLTLIYAAAHQHDHALNSAQQWRSRSLDNPHPADLAIATAQLGLHQPQLAAEQVSWCLADAIGSRDLPGQTSKALELYTRALCEQGQLDTAWQILRPYAISSPQWRRRWLRMITAVATDLPSVQQRIQQLIPLTTPGLTEDQLALGEAWLTLGSRFNDSASLDQARSMIEPLTDSSSAPSNAWMLLGAIQQQQNDLSDAEASFAAAVKADPNQAGSKNNLAMVMLLRNENPEAALSLATQALQQSPASSAVHSTLGEIRQKLNDLDGARQEFQIAVRLNTENAEALIGLATVLSQTNQTSGATYTLQQAEAVVQSSHPVLPPPVRDELKQLRGMRSKSAP
jgi:Flp pilus assembly protein TadD